MTMLHSLPCTPDRETMAAFVHALFRASGMRGRVELAWTSAQYPHRVSGARLFDLADLDDLVDFAVQINETPNRNAYIGPGLRREDAAPDRRSRDDQVQSAVALWADCDKEGALAAALDVCERLAIAPNIVVFTGQSPHLRGQLWWTLDEPCTDLDRVRALNGALAQRLGTDPAVVNIGRVMRVAGSVAWPLKEGRILEMTGLHEVATRQAAYTIDEVEHLLRRAGAMPEPVKTADILPFSGYDFNKAAPILALEDLLTQARVPGRWHASALAAVGHLISRGTPPDVVLDILTPALRCDGYSIGSTRQDLIPMVQGAIGKGWAPQPEQPPQAEPVPASPFLSIDDLLKLPPPEWLIQDYLIAEGVSVLFGPPGSFKSFIALDMALSVAHGIDWRGKPVKAAPTLYICAEGQYGFGARGLVWRTHRAKDAECAGFWVLPVPVNFLDPANVARLAQAITAHISAPKFIVVDTLIRNFGPGDENSTKDMAAFIAGIETLKSTLRAHIMIVHHSGKDEAKDERGSSALRGAVDAALRLQREDESDRVLLRVRKQKDAAEASPMALLVPIAEAVHPLTGEVVTSRIPTIDEAPVNPVQGAQPVNKIGRNERLVLSILDDGPATFGTIAKRSGADEGSLGRALRSLISKNMITKSGEVYLWRNASTGVWESEENQ